MAIRYRQTEGADAFIAEINTTPLVDVMLVLLIIFLITIPVVNSSVFVTLPREASPARAAQAEHILLTVDAAGKMYWFDTPLRNADDLAPLLARAAALEPQPELHVRGDARAEYDAIGRAVFAAQRAGILRIGFVTEPPKR
ncbi:MAG TPA: biopolymer transporter ExbD [Ramlibacter sp.]|nr:biopolymer transporter ExbD [Ramlibacter sp.]